MNFKAHFTVHVTGYSPAQGTLRIIGAINRADATAKALGQLSAAVPHFNLPPLFERGKGKAVRIRLEELPPEDHPVLALDGLPPLRSCACHVVPAVAPWVLRLVHEHTLLACLGIELLALGALALVAWLVVKIAAVKGGGRR